MVHAQNDGSDHTPRAFWWAAGVTSVNALTSGGFSVAGLASTLNASDANARVFAMYAAARSLPLAAATLWLSAKRSSAGLAVIAAVMTFVQASDALVGIMQHDVGKTAGPAVFAIATAFAARALQAHSNQLAAN